MPTSTHLQSTTWNISSVPMTASAMPISPASTPRRAVCGWLSHLSDRMNSAAATRYDAHVRASVRGDRRRTASAAASSRPEVARVLITAARLPAEHLQHAVGDPEPADDVGRRGDHGQRAEDRAESRVPLRQSPESPPRRRSPRWRWSATSAACATAATRGGSPPAPGTWPGGRRRVWVRGPCRRRELKSEVRGNSDWPFRNNRPLGF